MRSCQVILCLAAGVLEGLPHLALQRVHLLGMSGLCLGEPDLPLPL